MITKMMKKLDISDMDIEFERESDHDFFVTQQQKSNNKNSYQSFEQDIS